MSLGIQPSNGTDQIFPGENWFYYWKTSSSLWSSKFSEFTENNHIFIPINWAFHTETGETFDFGTSRPETNLKKLVTIAEQNNKKVTFLLPICPAPFLVNGGVPHLLARNISLTKDLYLMSLVDGDGQINKMYSFFDPNIYKMFAKFSRELGRYFSESGLSQDLWGVDCFYFSENKFRSYFEDASEIFMNGFSKFIALKKDENDGGNIQVIQNADEENAFKKDFYDSISSLYKDSAQHNLAANWNGVKKILFLGGAPKDFPVKMFLLEELSSYSKMILRGVCNNLLPSSVLINNSSKNDVFKRMIDNIVTRCLMPCEFKSSHYCETTDVSFRPLLLHTVFTNDQLLINKEWAQLKLFDFLSRFYGWTYKILNISELDFEEFDNECGDIKYFSSQSLLSEADFSKIIRLFMLGENVILNTAGLSEQNLKKLELFLLENSLEVQKVNFKTVIKYSSIGEGKLVFFNSEDMGDLSTDEAIDFWERLTNIFTLQHFDIFITEDVDAFWMTRLSSGSELTYDEVRRLNLYNFTSYKKKMRMVFKKNFALMKIIDEVNVKIFQRSHELEIEMFPGASVSIDFGLFSD